MRTLNFQIQNFATEPITDIGAGSGYYTFRLSPLVPEGQVLAIDIQPVQNYLLCKYWEKKYPAGSEGGKGYYCDVDVGEAVVFDNYRPHGDSTLDPSPTERVTIDMAVMWTWSTISR